MANHIFASRQGWYGHEEMFHRREWYCRPCNFACPSQSVFEHHLQETHQDLQIAIERCERPIQGLQSCPLCAETYFPTRLRRHLASHLQRLALFVLRSHWHNATSDTDSERQLESQENDSLDFDSNPSRKSKDTEQTLASEADPVIL
jgi:hypothetical protein